jgi:Hint domain
MLTTDLQHIPQADGQGLEPVARSTPCFTPGTLITTQRGELPVELLSAGDRVITRDNGIQPVRWVGKSQMFLQDFQAEPHLLPVFIRQGSFGKGLPERDMMISPNHRILVATERTRLRFAEREVLVAAKHLTSHGVHTVQSSGTTYIHFMCDRHEVVLADGIWTESFQPEDHTLKGIGNAQRLEIFELFPELKTSEGRAAYGSARKTITGAEMAENAL